MYYKLMHNLVKAIVCTVERTTVTSVTVTAMTINHPVLNTS